MLDGLFTSITERTKLNLLLLFFIMNSYTHSLQYLHSYLDYLQKKLVHILTLFVIFRVQYDEFRHFIQRLTLLDYLQCGTYILTIQYDHLRYYMITHVAYND